jgi:putative transposase
MKKFTSSGMRSDFCLPSAASPPHFRPGRHRLNANEYRREMTVRFATWNEVTGTATGA